MRAGPSRYAFALAVAAAAILLRAAVDPSLGEHGPLFASSAAVLLAALFGGLGPGVLALVIGVSAAVYLFIEPRLTFAVADPSRTASIVFYAFLGLFFCVVGELYRRNQIRLRENRNRYYTLFDTIQDGFCMVRMIYDKAGKPIDYLMVEGNPAYSEHTGLKDSIGKTVREVEPNIEPYWIETYGRIAKTGVPERFENYVQAWDRWFDVYAYRFGDPANHEVAIFFKDITARKKAERALAEANQRIDAGLMAGEVATYSWDIRNDRLRGDQNFVRMFGVLHDEHGSAPIGDFIKVIHPDDLPHVQEAISATLERGEFYEVEYRILARAGAADAPGEVPIERWVLVRGEIVERDAEGSPLTWSGVLMDITERKQAEMRVRASQETFQQLVENSPFGVYVVDADFRLAVVSAGAQQVFENIRPLIGRDFAEILRLIWPEPAASEFIALFRQTLETGQPHHSPNTVEQRADIGETEEYDWRIERIRMPDGRYGVVCHFYDMSERLRLEAAVRESEANFRALAENIPQLAWMTDATGWIFWYNRRWFEYTGTTLEEMQGWGWQKVHHADHVQRVTEKFRKHISSGESWEDTFPLRSKDGEYRWFLSRAFPIRNEKNEIVRWFGTNTDITELRETDERKDQFLAVLSHELRNPLAAIRMATKLLKNTRDLPASADTTVGIVDRQTKQLSCLVDDLLDMSRITRGTFEIHKQIIDLDSILQRAIEASAPSAECHVVELKSEKPCEPLLVDADPLRLSQVFANLIINACKYSEPGSKVDVFIERNDPTAVIRVRDFGVGIPADRIGCVFEMFAQVDPERDRRTGGLGIGLALAQGIVHMHGGTIEARSEGEGKGSEFIVTVPLARSPEPAAAVPDNGDVGRILETKKPRRILAVDDNADALSGLAGVLRSAGHDVLTAEDGHAALSIAAAHHPEAALLDIGMPGMDGYELAQRIRSTSWGRDMTLIALTGWGQEKDKGRAAGAGFHAHLTKPADIEAIERALNREHAPRR